MQVREEMEQIKEAICETNNKRRKRSCIQAQTVFFLWLMWEEAFTKLAAVGPGHVAHKHVVTWHRVT
jgi:hypothetical protein